MSNKNDKSKSLTDAELDIMVGVVEDDSDKKETKSRKVMSLFKPSVYNDIEKLAFLNRTSVNKVINDIVEEYIKNNHNLISKYDEIMAQLDSLRKK